MTPAERATDILARCWWRREEHPGEEPPVFAGLDKEIEAAIREAEVAARATAFAEASRLAREIVVKYIRSDDKAAARVADEVNLAIKAKAKA